MALAVSPTPASARQEGGATVEGDGTNVVSGELWNQYNWLNSGSSGTREPEPCTWTDTSGEEPVERQGTYRWRMTAVSQERWDELHDDWDIGEGVVYRYECWDDRMGCNGDDDPEWEPSHEDDDGCYGIMNSDTWCGSAICYFAINPRSMAMLALDQFVEELDEPEPEFSPPGGTTLVGFETWMWVPNMPPSQREDFPRLSVPGPQWVEAYATFDEVEWDMGDGSDPIRCPLSRDAESARANNCIHEYKRSSAGEPEDKFQGTVSVVWEVTYNGVGPDGPVADSFEIVTENAFSLAVAESQAVVTD